MSTVKTKPCESISKKWSQNNLLMIDKCLVITLCGSTRFKVQYLVDAVCNL